MGSLPLCIWDKKCGHKEETWASVCLHWKSPNKCYKSSNPWFLLLGKLPLSINYFKLNECFSKMELNSFFFIFRERKVKTRNDSDFSRSREAEISSASILFRFLSLDGDFYGAFFYIFFVPKKNRPFHLSSSLNSPTE